jgi:hypothetical protein
MNDPTKREPASANDPTLAMVFSSILTILVPIHSILKGNNLSLAFFQYV